MEWDNLLTIGLLVFALLYMFGRAANYRRPRTWSGDTQNEEGRRNTRTDSNYQGYDRWSSNPSDRGW
jgi:hypothetical protein